MIIAWQQTWQNLAPMENLQQLIVKVSIAKGWSDPLHQEQVRWDLNPIKAVTRPTTFELYLPPLGEAEKIAWEGKLPCTKVKWNSLLN